jgi:aspartyl-tRNA(Asn)/glutamyl-tRNA(Gln) amidotransferase subunit A
MTQLHQFSVAELARKLKKKEVSAVELAGHFLARVRAHADLGAYPRHQRGMHAEAGARRRPEHLRRRRRALAGVPIAHKDIFVTRDFPSTAGSKMLQNYRSPFDATVVRRLADAGAVTLGKLNCDEFAMGSSNENSAYAR